MRFAVGAILLMAATADAFAVNPTTSHQQLQLPYQPSSPHSSSSRTNNHYNNNNGSNNNIIIRYNSLRDLLGAPNDDKNHEILSNRNKSQNDTTPNSNPEETIDTSNADNFNNMLHPQRRNFQGRPSKDSGRLSHDNDELGLNNDRLQPFSFSGLVAKENTRVKKQQQQGSGGSALNKSVVINTEAPLSTNNDGTGGEEAVVRANDFNNMIGIAYSKKSPFTSNRNPPTQQNSSKDVDLETGMHCDKISTFSFSSQNTKRREGVVSGSNGGSSLREATWASSSKMKSSLSGGGGGDVGLSSDDVVEELTIGGESKEEKQKRMKDEVFASTTTSEEEPTDPSMSVDNFHNMINVDMSKNTGLKRFISPRTDGQVNHADRMETFSLLSTEDESDSSNLAPETLEVNHGDRMGTFSFASSSSSSGGGGANKKKKPKLQEMADAAAVGQKDESKSKPATSTAATGNNSNPPLPKVNINDSTPTESFDTRSQVYSLPQRGSLSSLASSLKTISRADRIKEIQIRTDPKLLHPDGMNVPRLNVKGDVMSMSSTTGGMNVFERIEADLANQIEVDDGGVEEIVAEKQGEDSSSDEIVADDNEQEEGDGEEDIVGEK